jgi:hypothetical protein
MPARRVRNVIDQRSAGVGAMLCCQSQRAGPRSTYAERGAHSTDSTSAFRGATGG